MLTSKVTPNRICNSLIAKVVTTNQSFCRRITDIITPITEIYDMQRTGNKEVIPQLQI